MGTKKVNNLLKGVAITGASVGGAAILGDADLVYAYAEETSDVIVVEPTVEAPAPAAQEMTQTVAVADTPAPVTDVPATATETPATEEGSTPVVEEPVAETPASAEVALEAPDLLGAPTAETPAETSVVEEAADAQIGEEQDNDAASLADTAEPATVYTEGQITESTASLSTLESELTSTSENLASSMSAASSEYESYANSMTATTEDYASKNYNIDKLDQLAAEVQANKDLEAEVRATYVAQNKGLDSNYYNNYGRQLAASMIKYNLVIDNKADPDYVDSASIVYYDGAYDNKHFCVIYLGVDGEVHEEYYDYVTADLDGNSLFPWLDRVEGAPRNVSPENYAANVGGLNILAKNVENGGYRKTQSYTFTNDNGESVTKTVDRVYWNFVNDENGHGKGRDYYGYALMDGQIAERANMQDTINSLSGAMNSTSTTMDELTSQTNQNQSELGNLDSAKSTLTSNSTRTAESLASSESAANSTSASELASESASAVASNQASTSESLSASTSAAIASQTASTAAYGGGSASASTTASVATTYSTAEAEENAAEVEQDVIIPAARNLASQQEISPISDAIVPLAVVNEETGGDTVLVQGEEMNAENTMTTDNVDTGLQIGEDDVARGISANINAGVQKKGFFFGLIALITGLFAYDKAKREEEKQ